MERFASSALYGGCVGAFFLYPLLALAFGWGLKLIFYYEIVIVLFSLLFIVISIALFFFIQMYILRDKKITILIIHAFNSVLFMFFNLIVFDGSLFSLIIRREPLLSINLAIFMLSSILGTLKYSFTMQKHS